MSHFLRLDKVPSEPQMRLYCYTVFTSLSVLPIASKLTWSATLIRHEINSLMGLLCVSFLAVSCHVAAPNVFGIGENS